MELIPFADLALARRFERAEAAACAGFAAARRRLQPECGAEWIECAGAYVVFDTVDSPVTQSFGLGVFEPITPAVLDEIERFYRDRGAHVDLEVCPLAGVDAIRLLCDRGYRPIEISSVTYRTIAEPEPPADGGIRVRVAGPEDARLWIDVSVRGWAHELPEVVGFLTDTAAIYFAHESEVCFLAEFDGVPAAAGALCIHEGVALFAGAATAPEFRRRGLQAALLEARLRYAFERGCSLAMMVAMAGSDSQRNAERKGFRVAYTRTKWRLGPAPTDAAGTTPAV